MILDTLQNRHLYTRLGPRFELAFNALADGIAKRPDGTYDLAGADVRAMVQRYTTRPIEQCPWETHRKYIDLQFMDSGVEKMGWCPVDQLIVRDPYNAEKDATFYDATGGEFVALSAGMFVIFFPTDGHRGGIAMQEPAAVTKVVFKIAV